MIIDENAQALRSRADELDEFRLTIDKGISIGGAVASDVLQRAAKALYRFAEAVVEARSAFEPSGGDTVRALHDMLRRHYEICELRAQGKSCSVDAMLIGAAAEIQQARRVIDAIEKWAHPTIERLPENDIERGVLKAIGEVRKLLERTGERSESHVV